MQSNRKQSFIYIILYTGIMLKAARKAVAYLAVCRKII